MSKNMNIINLNLRKSISLLTSGAMLLGMFAYSPRAYADHVDIHIQGAGSGAVVFDGNATSTVLASFSPDLNLASSTSASLQANATTSATAYYGVDIESATTTGDVYWQITVSHATEALSFGDVSITEKGYFDATLGTVADSGYAPTVVSGDLVFTGNTGWEVFAGDEFTNVDQIVFDDNAPLGIYTVTRSLIDNATDDPINASFSFTIDLTAAADITPPSAPVITFPTNPHSTSTTPIVIGGTAEASSTISVTGGASTSTATTSGAGNWSASVDLTASSTNMLSVTAADASGNTSTAATLTVTHFIAATSSPIITLLGDNPAQVFACNGFVEPGFSAVDSTGASITATSSGSINVSEPGTYVITYTATDAEGHTATTTRTVVSIECSSGGGGGGGGGPSGATGIERAAQVTPQASTIPGQAIGLSTFQQFLLPPGQVLGAAIFRFDNNLRVGSRGTDVTELQRKLTELGFYSGPITGYFGGLTRAAVVRFQRAHGLPATGFFGPMTRGIMNS